MEDNLYCKQNTSAKKMDTSTNQPSSNNGKRVEMQDLMRWKHLDPSSTSEKSLSLLEDPILKGSLRYLSYIFMNEVHASAIPTT